MRGITQNFWSAQVQSNTPSHHASYHIHATVSLIDLVSEQSIACFFTHLHKIDRSTPSFWCPGTTLFQLPQPQMHAIPLKRT